MKRGAERQLTKDAFDDGDDDDDIEEIQDPGQGFQKADDAALAKRQVRALPKRALAGTPTKTPSLNGLTPTQALSGEDREAAPPPKFGGFVGFGMETPTPNPFTFAAQSPTAPVPAFGSPGIGTGTKPSQPPSSLGMAVQPVAPGAVELYPSGSGVSPPKPATPASTEESNVIALKYYKSLRGLNASFLLAISTAVDKDPFFDVASLVESYKNLRTTIQSEFDGSPQPSQSSNPPSNSSSTFGEKPLASEKPAAPQFSMPKPPSGPFAGLAGSGEGSSQSRSTSESGTKTAGFSFPAFTPPSSSAPTQLPFGFAPKSSEPSVTSLSPSTPSPPKPVFALGISQLDDSSVPKSTSGFSFATPPTTTTKSIFGSISRETESSSATTPAPLLQPASMTSVFGSSGVPNFFVGSKTTSAFGTSDSTSKPTSVFGTSIFGSNSAGESSRPSPFFVSTSDDKDTSKSSASVFGSTTTTSSTPTGSIFGSSDKPFAFGSASPPKPSAFGFGKPSGSIGNPVGFGFGAPSTKVGDSTSASESSAPPTGFSFGAPPAKPAESMFSPPPTEKSAESTPQPDAEGNENGGEVESAKLLPTSTHDEEGEGEEDEETTHVVKCKVYRLFKTGDKNEWKDLGVGMFRLKKHKETNIRRVLMRNSSTGRILINFRIYATFKPTLAKTLISFVGYENNTLTSFRIRVKTEEQASELKHALDRQVAAVQTAE
ncbi:hypothetical protein PAXRUDRAFT_830235 [Paxillus rubicundulus Ve08.2h10]|uniref:RanBD1 domain-containing protein n=1 Tax=Paxillus rubicundulus Ve08.2h10 TaxID=930991 RepID=A0A0D0DTT8_9AGAM|nr:hypothetical protein PAXRUDRAFT_830235 [Paxillus rubicundulus Ve08.2h10]